MKKIGILWVALLTAVLPAVAQQVTHKLGVFDAAVVFDRSIHGQALKADVERLRDLRLKEMNQAQQDLNALQQEMRTKELTFSDETRTEMLQRISQKQIDLQRMNDDASREIQAEFTKAQQRLQKGLLSVVDAVGQEGAFTMILERGATVYSSPDVDVTALVLEKFNVLFPGPVRRGGGSRLGGMIDGADRGSQGLR